MLEYETFLGGISVKLGGKRIGVIQRVPPTVTTSGGWQYLPQGLKKWAGDVYPSIDACFQSLEAAQAPDILA
jgi:hypothetical protein